MTRRDFESQIERSVVQFSNHDDISDELADTLVGEGLFTGSDLAKLGAGRLAKAFGVAQALATRVVKDVGSKIQVTIPEKWKERQVSGTTILSAFAPGNLAYARSLLEDGS